MRANEFISESKKSQMRSSMKKSGIHAKHYANNDTYYDMYRFGVAIAGARSAEQRLSDSPGASMAPSSAWGENEIIIGYDLDTDIIDYALNIVGLKSSDKKLISTKKSEEMSEVDTHSPIQSFKGYERCCYCSRKKRKST